MVCSTCMQGWRVSMEDAHFHVLGKRGEGNYSCAEDYNFLKPTITFLHKAGDDNYLWSPLRPNFILCPIVPISSFVDWNLFFSMQLSKLVCLEESKVILKLLAHPIIGKLFQLFGRMSRQCHSLKVNSYIHENNCYDNCVPYLSWDEDKTIQLLLKPLSQGLLQV